MINQHLSDLSDSRNITWERCGMGKQCGMFHFSSLYYVSELPDLREQWIMVDIAFVLIMIDSFPVTAYIKVILFQASTFY